MTDVIGRWRIQEVLRFNDAFERIWVSREEVLADDTLDDSEKQTLTMEMIFTGDGVLKMVMPLPEGIPQEELDAALQSGELSLYDDKTMILEEHPWKCEDGKLLYDTGMKGEVFGEAVSSWDELKEENGMLRMMMYRLTKV